MTAIQDMLALLEQAPKVTLRSDGSVPPLPAPINEMLEKLPTTLVGLLIDWAKENAGFSLEIRVDNPKHDNMEFKVYIESRNFEAETMLVWKGPNEYQLVPIHWSHRW